ncbi:hypothetical protein [Hymenobacter edaphi]|uniref:Uncharacterized protein n=1 Tax=Hymenobacter edaphi TaxID=2211146 RepID=A0A328B5D4_9BACT|nr:hypothetical protein [Hymenobacter edaphi]RAK62079.1 hypothetical protein DLM85_24390 [Hymenobacter edaphi]
MNSTRILVRTTTANFWWGAYGLTNQADWEDLELCYEGGERIGRVCLNGKEYLRDALPELQADPAEKAYAAALQTYLADTGCHYWFYYDEPGSPYFYEAPYEAPRNANGVKPRFTDIWHPDERVGLATVQDAVREFARAFLGLAACEVIITEPEPLEKAVATFKGHQLLFNGDKPVKIHFADNVISELAEVWGITPEATLQKLQASTQ